MKQIFFYVIEDKISSVKTETNSLHMILQISHQVHEMIYQERLSCYGVYKQPQMLGL